MLKGQKHPRFRQTSPPNTPPKPLLCILHLRITMSPTSTDTASAAEAKNGTSTPFVNTMPDSTFSWQITLAQKVIAITGANRGIGLGIAEVCLANSAQFVYSMDLMEPGEETIALQTRYPNFRYIQTDVTSEESIEKAVNQIVEETGRIDGLVANAGMTKHQPALKFERPELERMFNLNVSGLSALFGRVVHAAARGCLRAAGFRRIFLRADCRSEVYRAGDQGVYCYDC